MQTVNRYLPLGRHVVFKHNYKMPKTIFAAIDRVHIPIRGGDWNKALPQREQRWIFILHATVYPGLNESISFAPSPKGVYIRENRLNLGRRRVMAALYGDLPLILHVCVLCPSRFVF